MPEGYIHVCPGDPTVRTTALPPTWRCAGCNADVPYGSTHQCGASVTTTVPMRRTILPDRQQPETDEWETLAPASESLVRLQAEVAKWADETFPNYRNGRASALVPLKHLVREGDAQRGIKPGEAWELWEAILAYQDEPTEANRARVADEIADCQCLLITIARLSGVDLLTATRAKFEELQRRKWGEPDKDGVVERLREASE